MRLLLDTHLLLWATSHARRLPAEARRLLDDETHDVFYSAASIWEVAIKVSLSGKALKVDIQALRGALPEMGFVELPVTSEHAARVVLLPPIHRDPFDRLLVAQSLVEPLTLLTNDKVLERYGSSVLVV